MNKKNKLTAIVAIAIALAFVTPVAAVANIRIIDLTNSENTNDIKTMIKHTNIDSIVVEETINIAIPLTDNTIFVDDNRPPEWYDATHVKTITEGIVNATAGDTVYVYNGTYYEIVTVNKQLDLVGESGETVIIDGSGGYASVVTIAT
ncbi:unnamed protein product, partial [marine sediment metagenome]